jgi:hypothetical protein
VTSVQVRVKTFFFGPLSLFSRFTEGRRKENVPEKGNGIQELGPRSPTVYELAGLQSREAA